MRKRNIIFLGFILSIFFLAFYVLQVNGLTASAYSASLSEKQLQILKDENKLLEATAAKTFSAPHFANLAESLKFEKVRNISYIQIIAGTVARGE
ncbi:MAG: hypothetical protein HYS52_00560 [Candidatus Wildermuthbacteria bacterium]|nr:hypothetical protein [Candidatus Wildermuthbacteria bacterium]